MLPDPAIGGPRSTAPQILSGCAWKRGKYGTVTDLHFYGNKPLLPKWIPSLYVGTAKMKQKNIFGLTSVLTFRLSSFKVGPFSLSTAPLSITLKQGSRKTTRQTAKTQSNISLFFDHSKHRRQPQRYSLFFDHSAVGRQRLSIQQWQTVIIPFGNGHKLVGRQQANNDYSIWQWAQACWQTTIVGTHQATQTAIVSSPTSQVIVSSLTSQVNNNKEKKKITICIWLNNNKY